MLDLKQLKSLATKTLKANLDKTKILSI